MALLIARLCFLPVLASLIGCGSDDALRTDIDQTFTREMAESAIAEAPFDLEGYVIHAVCGPSKGESVFTSDDGKIDWAEDGISGGRMIYVSGENGEKADLIFRDAGGSYYSAAADGAVVRINGQSPEHVWVVSYEETGVVETHQIIDQAESKIVLWTSNKPISLFSMRSARTFVAYCHSAELGGA